MAAPNYTGQESAILLHVYMWWASLENGTVILCLWKATEKYLLIENLEGKKELHEAWYIRLMKYYKPLK